MIVIIRTLNSLSLSGDNQLIHSQQEPLVAFARESIAVQEALQAFMIKKHFVLVGRFTISQAQPASPCVEPPSQWRWSRQDQASARLQKPLCFSKGYAWSFKML